MRDHPVQAGLAAVAALVACVGGSAPAFETKERMQGASLIVELICEEALLEDTFIEYLASRADDDLERYPSLEDYRFRLSLIPEDGDEPISVLFSWMFYDADANRTSDVEAFEFVVPRAEASTIGAAGAETRRKVYEALRERQPRLNPDFARRRPPPPPSSEPPESPQES